MEASQRPVKTAKGSATGCSLDLFLTVYDRLARLDRLDLVKRLQVAAPAPTDSRATGRPSLGGPGVLE